MVFHNTLTYTKPQFNQICLIIGTGTLYIGMALVPRHHVHTFDNSSFQFQPNPILTA